MFTYRTKAEYVHRIAQLEIIIDMEACMTRARDAPKQAHQYTLHNMNCLKEKLEGSCDVNPCRQVTTDTALFLALLEEIEKSGYASQGGSAGAQNGTETRRRANENDSAKFDRTADSAKSYTSEQLDAVKR